MGLMKTPMSMQPTGWFQVAWTADLAVGEVKPLRYFNRDLVMFRDLGGQAHVLNAHCQHLGANLAFGGCVVDDGIQCPFHGWVWNGDGRNVHIPYETRPNRGRRVRSYPVAEINDGIYMWHDVLEREPLHPVPEAFPLLGEHVSSRTYHPFTPECRERFQNVKMHPQMVAENSVDPYHFKFVHKTPISPKVLTEVADETTWSAKVGFGKRWSEGVDRPGETLNTLVFTWLGIGVSYNGEHTRDGVRAISICPTPVDETHSDIFASYWISEDGGDFAERLNSAKLALPDDIKIWGHQQFTDPPGLTISDAAGFREMRAWASNFYPDESLRKAELVEHGV